jgi:hypothetical protein
MTKGCTNTITNHSGTDLIGPASRGGAIFAVVPSFRYERDCVINQSWKTCLPLIFLLP